MEAFLREAGVHLLLLHVLGQPGTPNALPGRDDRHLKKAAATLLSAVLALLTVLLTLSVLLHGQYGCHILAQLTLHCLCRRKAWPRLDFVEVAESEILSVLVHVRDLLKLWEL